MGIRITILIMMYNFVMMMRQQVVKESMMKLKRKKTINQGKRYSGN